MLKRLFPLLLLVSVFSCEKKTDDFTVDPLSEYYPLAVGDFIDYYLDSTVFETFGTVTVTRHYQAREIVEDSMRDNQNRKAFRVVRYLRETEQDQWRASITYMVTPLKNSIEVTENNLRFIKLISPVRPGVTWKGNRYIDTYSADLNVSYMEGWDYTYDSVGMPLTIGGLSFENTVKVFERDEFLGQDPAIPGTQYAEETIASEKYAKGIGLIYREFLHWEFQGPQPGKSGYYEGYGIRMSITGHGKQ